MIKTLLSTFFLLTGLTGSAQIYLNPGVDTSLKKVKIALHFYENYLQSFDGKKLPDMAKFWPLEELQKRTIPDQLIYALNDYPLYSQGYNPTILYIRPEQKFIHFKIQFSSSDTSKHIMTMAVVNSYIGFDYKKQPYFINPLTINTANWRISRRRNIEFNYPSYHKFNSKRADTLISKIKLLEKDWNLPTIAIRYYLANNNDELYLLKGFDYALSMGNIRKPSGKSDDKDNQIFCGGLGENYFHEVVHLYLNHRFPNSPLQEGMAVFYGGSMGRPIKWHLKRVNQYLTEHPNVDLSNLDDFWYTDPFTNPGSAIQGMICNLVYKKDGLKGLKRLIQYTSFSDIFEKEFNTSKVQLNAFLRKAIALEASN